jgi:hypothetical protein
MSEKKELKIYPMPLDETEDKKVKNLDKRLFGHPFRSVVVASSGGGKSSFIYNLMKQKRMYGGFFDQILIWNGSPRYNEEFKKLPHTSVYNEYNEEEIKELMDGIKELQEARKAENKRFLRILLVFDDYSSKGLTKRNAVNIVDDIFCSGRNAGVSVIITAQVYKHINRNCRMSNVTHLVVMGVNQEMMKEIADEHQSELATPDDVVNIYQTIRKDDNYGHLIVDYTRPMKERFRTLNKVYNVEK